MSYKVDCPQCGWVVRSPVKLHAPQMECPACGGAFEAIFIEDIVAPSPDELPIESNPRPIQRAEPKRFLESLWAQIIITVVLAGGILFYAGSCFDSKKQENRAFIEASKRLDAGDFSGALQGYQNFVRDFPASPHIAVATTQIQQIGQRLESQMHDASARAEQQQQAAASRANQETMIKEWEEARRNPSQGVRIKWTFKVSSYSEETIRVTEANILVGYEYQITAYLKSLMQYPVVISSKWLVHNIQDPSRPFPKPEDWPDSKPKRDDWIIVEGFARGVTSDGSVILHPTRITNIGYKGSGDEAN